MTEKTIDLTLLLKAQEKLIGPVLTRVSQKELDSFVSGFIRRRNREQRLGMAYLERYSRFGYTNKELFHADNSKAFYMLDNYVKYGILSASPVTPEEGTLDGQKAANA